MTQSEGLTAPRPYEEPDISPQVFEQIAWVLPRELSNYDFLTANRQLIAHLATGRIKPSEFLAAE